jgi:hypothetical protein
MVNPVDDGQNPPRPAARPPNRLQNLIERTTQVLNEAWSNITASPLVKKSRQTLALHQDGLLYLPRELSSEEYGMLRDDIIRLSYRSPNTVWDLGDFEIEMIPNHIRSILSDCNREMLVKFFDRNYRTESPIKVLLNQPLVLFVQAINDVAATIPSLKEIHESAASQATENNLDIASLDPLYNLSLQITQLKDDCKVMIKGLANMSSEDIRAWIETARNQAEKLTTDSIEILRDPDVMDTLAQMDALMEPNTPLAATPIGRAIQTAQLSIVPKLLKEFRTYCSGQPYANAPIEQLWEGENAEHADSFRRWFYLVPYMADYKNETTRPLLAARILSLFASALENPEYKNLLLGQIIEGCETCVDRVALSLDNMELGQKSLGMADASLEEVAKFLKGMFITDFLRTLAIAKIAQLKTEDPEFDEDLEVILVYQQELKRKYPDLELPVTGHAINFATCAKTTAQDLEDAWIAVQEQCNDDKVAEHLLKNQTWTDRLKADFAEEFARLQTAEVRENQVDKLMALEERRERGDISREEYEKEALILDMEREFLRKKTLEVLQM